MSANPPAWSADRRACVGDLPTRRQHPDDTRGYRDTLGSVGEGSSVRGEEAAMKVHEIMTPDPETVNPGDTIAHAARLMRDGNVGMLPVVETDGLRTLVGVLTDRDITVRCVAEDHRGRCRVRDHMTADQLATVDADADVEDAVARMGQARVRRLPVVTTRMRVVGVLSQADLARRLGPREPRLVSELLERVSEPAVASSARA
jgi:CBS domain-containing protein